ncbi:MAG: hypothetical protein R3E97_10560 [Candidatus Eisenbacteria bacterium]
MFVVEHQLHPSVDASDANDHYVAEYATMLSYEPNSVVALSGRTEGEELVLTVSVRNASENPVDVDPAEILVCAGDHNATTMTLEAFSPSRYLERQTVAQASKLATRAESVDWIRAQSTYQVSEITRVDPVALDAEGSFLGQTDAPDTWTSAVRLSQEIEREAEQWGVRLDAVASELLWPATLGPEEYTYGKIALPNPAGTGEYTIVVPVGQDLHAFRLLTDPSGTQGSPNSPVPALVTEN